MSTSLRILGVSGSLRRASLNTALLRAAIELAPDGVRIESFDIRPIPLFDGDVEAQGLPAPVQAFREAIRAADGLLIATPEYNNSVPGVLKNAVDWASRGKDQPFPGKPVAIMGASPGGFGTVRSQMAWQPVMRTLGSRVMPQPEVLVSRADKLVGPDGALADAATRDKLRAFLAAFADWIRVFAAAQASRT